jgi:general secretion pathway protein D
LFPHQTSFIFPFKFLLLPVTVSLFFLLGVPSTDFDSAFAQATLPKVPPAQPSVTQEAQPPAEPEAPSSPAQPAESGDQGLITLDFNNVDLVTFVKFVSEITGKNIIIDERVRGKVTIFSPSKMSMDQVYEVFLSVIQMKGFAAVPVGETVQIMPSTEVPLERDIFVYFLEYANAEDAAKLLSGIVGQTAKTKPGRRAPTRATKVKSVADFEGQIQITPDKVTNALIVRATAEDYEKLRQIIQQLDIKRHQVFVEAVILEVSQDSLKEFGTELGAAGFYQTPDETLFGLGGFNQDPEILSTVAEAASPLGLNLGNVNLRAVITALQDLTDANILSTPQILTTHNQKARIVVGQNVPFVTGSSTTTGGLVQQTVQRQDVGVTLELTPQVMEGDRIQLDIRQEISTVQETAESVLVSIGPTTNKREALTSVIVDDRQTVVIGGLMRDDVSKVERKIPLLGDIPLIGWLFKFRSRKAVKTNLLIFLTPHIVHDADEMEAIRKQKSDEMKEALLSLDKGTSRARDEFLDAVNLPVSNPRK